MRRVTASPDTPPTRSSPHRNRSWPTAWRSASWQRSRARRARSCVQEADSILVPFVASVAVGCAILAMVAADRRTRPRGGLEWTAAVLVAWVNSLVLFTAALGIDKF